MGGVAGEDALAAAGPAAAVLAVAALEIGSREVDALAPSLSRKCPGISVINGRLAAAACELPLMGVLLLLMGSSVPPRAATRHGTLAASRCRIRRIERVAARPLRGRLAGAKADASEPRADSVKTAPHAGLQRTYTRFPKTA
jgi:hypothetical protein